MTKTFKIGESAIGGIVKVTINGSNIKIQFLDWNDKEEVSARDFVSGDSTARGDILEFLEDGTTYFYAEKVLKYIESNAKLGGSRW